jgi:hypothetical protein
MEYLRVFKTFNENKKEWTLFDDIEDTPNRSAPVDLPYPKEYAQSWQRLINAAYRDGRLKGDDYQRDDIKNEAFYLGDIFDKQPDKSNNKRQEILDLFYKELEAIKTKVPVASFDMGGKNWILIIPEKDKTWTRYLYVAKVNAILSGSNFYLKKERPVRAYLYIDKYKIIGKDYNGKLYLVDIFADKNTKNHIGITIGKGNDRGKEWIYLDGVKKTPGWEETVEYEFFDKYLDWQGNFIKKLVKEKELSFYTL